EKTNCHPRTLTVLVTAGAKLPVRLTLEDRVLEYLVRAAAENPDNVMCHMELGHYYMIAGEPKKAAKAYSEALRLARGPDVDENSRRKVEQNVRRDQQRGGELGARMGAELDRIMRGRGWSRMH
ncbi:MAG: tetratricopeptide repeat protein, partial [Planctomycetota bacterium]